jgi:hypothetical protein
MPKPPLKWIVTGNFTVDGAVAYMTPARGFARTAREAAVFTTKDEAEAARLHALNAEAEICDPYITEVAESPDGLDLLSARERIRCQGPTIRYGRHEPKSTAV